MLKINIYTEMKTTRIFVKFAFLYLFLVISVFGQEEKADVRPLPIGQKVERKLYGGEIHPYSIRLNQGQVLQLNLQEKGIDVLVVLSKVDKEITNLKKSGFGVGYDRETLTFIAEQAGTYLIMIGSSDESAQNGSYQLITEIKETATKEIKERIEAEHLLSKGVAGVTKQNLEGFRDAVVAWEESLTLWKNLNDGYWEGYTRNFLGIVNYALGEKQKALSYYQQALSLRNNVGDKNGEADTLIYIGRIYIELSEKEKAINFFVQSLPLKKDVGDKNGETKTLISIGSAYYELKDRTKALEYFNQVLPLINDKSDKKDVILVLTTIATLNYALGEKQKALSFYKQALPSITKIQDKKGESDVLTYIGRIYSEWGENENALNYFVQILPIKKSMGDKRGEIETLNTIGGLYLAINKNKDALNYYEQILTICRSMDDKGCEATTLNNIGKVYSDLDEKSKALDYYKQALPLRKAANDKKGEAVTLNNIGGVYSDLGERQKALEYLDLSLQIVRAVNDNYGEAVTLNNIGSIYSSLGEKQKALEYFSLALPILEKFEDKRSKAGTLSNMGLVYDDLGEELKALDFYNQALIIVKNIGDKRGEARTLVNIGGVYRDLGEKQIALTYFTQVLPIFTSLNDKRSAATVINSMGAIFDDLGNEIKAISYYNISLAFRKSVGDKYGEAVTLFNIGGAYEDLGEMQKALDFYNQSLPLRRAVGDKSGESLTLNHMMIIWASLNYRTLAVFYGKQSVNLYQQLRSNIIGLDKQTQQTYLKSVEHSYRKLAEILISTNRLNEAQQIFNLFKDQQFFDFNLNPNEPIKQIAQTPRETENALRYQQSSEQIGKVSSELDELKRKIGTRQPTSEETIILQKLESDLKTATDAFLAVLKQAEIEFSKPADEKDKVGDIPDTTQMQTALRNLNQHTGQKTVVIYTLVGEDNFRALIVSPDGIKAVSSPIKGTELNDKALKLWGLLQSDRYDTTVLSKQIYDVVFKPIEAELPKNTTTIMWSLDYNLRYIPMAALFDGKQFLSERFNHVNFTRADGERMTRAVNPNWTGTGFGSSNAQTVELLGDKISFNALPGVTAELREIFKQSDSKTGILTGEVLPDKQFTKMGFLESLKQKRPVVHIASHFSFRPGDEARSFLLLGDGTAFTLNDMKKETNLFQGVDLLTLSACNTAATQADANGREVDGFAELAQRLGAGAVMATLWSVSDSSTPWLMRDFYAIRQSKSGMTKAEALQQAQMALLNGTAEVKPLPDSEKGASTNKLKIVIVPKGGKRDANDTRTDIIYLDASDAPLFKKNGKKPFAHPYYWSPFILFGNWR